MLFVIVFYLVVRYASLEGGTHFGVMRTMLFFPLFIPCVLNETKVLFILLPVFLVLLLSSRRRFYKAAPFLVLGGILVYLAYYYYMTNVAENINIFDPVYVEKYLLTNPTGYGEDLPRFQRLVLLFHMVKGDLGWILLGMGYGIIGGGSVVRSSRLGRSLYYLVTGSRILLFRTLIQGGILGMLTVAGAVYAWFRTNVPLPHTVRQFRWFLVFSIAVVWFYDEAIYDRVYAPVLAFMMFWIREGGIAGETIEDVAPEEETQIEGEAFAR
jgi:hypothetical protein